MPTLLRPVQRWAALALVVLATGCLTIEENYTFKKDGSGTMEYVVDLSAFSELMKSMEKMGDGKGGSDKEGFKALEMGDQVAQLKGLPGIKKVKLKKEKDDYVQRISFAFKDLTALNAALNVLMPDSTGAKKQFFHWEGNTLVRLNNSHANELGGDMAGDPENDTLNMTAMLQSMQYKYSFAFANEVAGTDVAAGMTKESPNAKQVKLSTDWSVIMKDPEALDLRITLNK
ncbi:MAG: hypothetical protein JST66_09595 [Bacteroidetes bacterium]|nr:hypothetical protein [Bacteroidota bacterium]